MMMHRCSNMFTLFFLGFFEQVSWSTCSEREGKKNRPRHTDYKVINYAHSLKFLIA